MTEMVKIHSIERCRGMDDEELREHLKEVGRRIIADADTLQIPANGTTKISMIATVAAASEITRVKYFIERLADPRIPSRVQKGEPNDTD